MAFLLVLLYTIRSNWPHLVHSLTKFSFYSQNCQPETNICCTYQAPPPISTINTPVPFASCPRDSDCVASENCRNGEISAIHYVKKQEVSAYLWLPRVLLFNWLVQHNLTTNLAELFEFFTIDETNMPNKATPADDSGFAGIRLECSSFHNSDGTYVCTQLSRENHD